MKGRVVYCYKKFILFFLASFVQILVSRPNTSEIKINAVRTTEKIKIDGILSEKTWKGKSFAGLEQQDPNQGSAPSQFSEVWVA